MNKLETRTRYEAARRLLAQSRRILVSGHLSPDGDSLGSMIALSRLLRAAGYDAYATADVRTLGKPGFLEGVADLIPLRKLRRRKFDLFIYVDAATPARLPPEVRPFAEKLPTLILDHHATSQETGTVSIIDPSAAAAGELVWRFAKWMEWPLDRVVAEALWVALVCDLLKYGVRTAYINDVLYCSFNARATELKRRAWRSLHIWKNRKVAEVTLTRDDFREVRGSKAEAEDVIEIPRSVAKNEVALFFYQIPDRTQETRCSIRTRGELDATILATKFGGGGHRKAAGCTIKAPMGSAKRQMRAAVKDLLKNGVCRKTAPVRTSPPPTPPTASQKA